MERIVNLLRGEVTGRVESGFPERVLNLCAEYDVRFWDLNWESPVSFTFTVSRRDWRRLRKLNENTGCTMTALSWHGTPFFLGRLHHRYALWIGILVCSAAVFLGSFFIWDFQIEGNKTVSDEEILRALEAHGVGFGTFGFTVNSYYLRNYILLDIPELSYIAVNVKGCRAYVQVRESVPAPAIIDRKAPSNTVAAKDALITAIQPWDGEKQVLPGMTVTKGQLLISGVSDTAYGGVRYLSGMGKVFGRTWYHLQCMIPCVAHEKEYDGTEKIRHALVLGKTRVDFSLWDDISGGMSDKIIERSQWVLPGDIPLPVTSIKETYMPFSVVTRERSEEEALALGDIVLSERLTEYLEEGKVLQRELSCQRDGDTYIVTLAAECEEQVGKIVEIQT